MNPATPEPELRPADRSRLHLRFGWWSLLGFLVLGAVLETLHGFKVAWYMDVANETRRLMWTLAHAHGTLLALVNIAFGLTIRAMPELAQRWRTSASACLVAAALLLPAGFFLGGIVIYAGDPGLAIFLVPAGAVLLLIGVARTAWTVNSRP